MSLLKKIIAELSRPDDQKDSWYGWASNQMAHAFLGAVIALFAGVWWLLAVLGVSIVKEILDLSKGVNSSALIDSVTDIFFWVFGAGAIANEESRIWFLICIVAVLLIGIAARMRK